MLSVLRDKKDIKIFILYLMRQINYPLRFDYLNDITVQDGVIDYFEFADCFAELVETGNVDQIELDGEELYVISEQGIRVSDALQDSIPKTMREKCLKSALRLLSFRKRGAEVKCNIEQTDDGQLIVHAVVLEAHREVMDVRLRAADQAQAKKMQDYFLDKPEIVYRGVLTVFTGEVDYLVN